MAVSWKNPDVWIPAIAAGVGGLALCVGWKLGSDAGFAIASGIVSVLGLVTSAFVARAIWTVRSTSVVVVNRHRSLRRIENLLTAIRRAHSSKQVQELRALAGNLKAVLSVIPLPDGTQLTVESLRNVIDELERKDDRSTVRIGGGLITPLANLMIAVEITVESEGQTP